MVYQAGLAQYVDPAQRPDNIADPERQHEQQHQQEFELRPGLIEKIGRNISEHDAKQNCFQCNPKGSQKHPGIEEVLKELLVVAQLEGRNIGAGGSPNPEAVDDDKTDGNHHKEEDGTQ